MKKVSFGGNRPSAPLPQHPDEWVRNRNAPNRERMKRLTIDLPVSLHRRLKSHCAVHELVMADIMRELLEQRFPESPGEGAIS